MFKLFVIGSIVILLTIVECRSNQLSVIARCLKNDLKCTSSKQCCSGFCCDGKCTKRPCRRPHESCNNSTDICCPGQICRKNSNTCCRLNNETALSPSECCVQPATASGGVFICPCSGHAQPCKKNEDCCYNAKCSTAYPQFGPICL